MREYKNSEHKLVQPLANQPQRCYNEIKTQHLLLSDGEIRYENRETLLNTSDLPPCRQEKPAVYGKRQARL